MLLAVQYYRPPFPASTSWENDMDQVAAAGFDAIQLWVTWGWVEPEPGTFDFDDYDRIMDAAHARGLKVVLSTIGEVQPFWIPRMVPESAMINHLGQRVVSTPRRENNAGLTPGGCWDHPEVLDRMSRFLQACAQHFRDHPALSSWDVWNETRWSVHAGEYVCYCENTVTRFRDWLADRHGDLDGLNEAWHRRYRSWDDVHPGTIPRRMYTDLVEFQRFLTWRSGEHMRFRAETVRALDADHVVGGHGVAPSAYSAGVLHEQALQRGNDADHVASLDSYGISMYPDFFIHDEADFGGRLTAARSACGDKPLWVCELEAAPTGIGFNPGRPVSGSDLRRWLWTSFAHGAKAAICWQWYDELVGPESASFGLSGDDGNSEERLASVADVATTFREHAALIGSYVPDPGKVGVIFDQGGYHLDWAEHGVDDELVSGSVQGYIRALEHTGTPYTVLHASHLSADQLEDLSLVILPAPFVIPATASNLLTTWVNDGGTLATETELDGWTEQGIYRYPNDRPFATALGLRGHGRRPVTPTVDVAVGDSDYALVASTWTEPIGSADPSTESEPTTTFQRSTGSGQVLAIGTFAGYAYFTQRYPAFEAFVAALVDVADAHGALPLLSAENVLVRSGSTSNGWLVLVANHTTDDGHAEVRIPPGTTGQPVEIGRSAGASFQLRERTMSMEVPAGATCVLHLTVSGG
nr:beta-galactosidase [Ruania rhizosphaerae]